MVNVIKTSGWPFSFDTSNYHGHKPSKFEWHHGDCDSSDVTVYFDLDHLGGFRSGVLLKSANTYTTSQPNWNIRW